MEESKHDVIGVDDIDGNEIKTELENEIDSKDFNVDDEDRMIHKKYSLRENRKFLEPGINEDEIACTYKCDNCIHTFQTKTGLLNHMRTHQKSTVYTCAQCNDTFKTNSQLVSHKETHKNEDTVFLCNICKFAFTDHYDYVVHQISHTTRGQYKCYECGKYYNPKYIKDHIMIHYDKKIKCKICHAMINGEKNMKSHITSHNSTVKCVECGKECANTTYYKYHIRKHTGIKPYQCLYCGVGFYNNLQRKQHTRLHTGEKPYECPICHHRVVQEGDLKKHIATHNKVKKFECDYCSKKFLHKESLLSHIRGHTKSRVFVCDICKATFPTRTGLKTHTVYSHFDDREFKCDICDISFKSKKCYKRHTTSKSHINKVYAANKISGA